MDQVLPASTAGLPTKLSTKSVQNSAVKLLLEAASFACSLAFYPSNQKLSVVQWCLRTLLSTERVQKARRTWCEGITVAKQAFSALEMRNGRRMCTLATKNISGHLPFEFNGIDAAYGACAQSCPQIMCRNYSSENAACVR